MSRMYTAVFGSATGTVAVPAVQDLFEIAPAVNKPCRIAGLYLGQASDVGDAAEEILHCCIVRVPATFTSGNTGGTAPTPRLVSATGGAAGFTAEINNTVVATTSGTLEFLMPFMWNIRTGSELFLPPEFQFEAVNGTGLVVRLLTAPADSLTASGTIFVIEEG